MSDQAKASRSRAYGRSYLVFDANGEEYATIRGRLLGNAIDDAKACGGEVWLAGRCVVPATTVAGM